MSEEKRTCADCMHWDTLAQRAYSVDRQLQMQAPCNKDFPRQFTRPWRWNWERRDCFVSEILT